MTEKFRNKFRIPSARLQNWDYGSDGAYFITICTKGRMHNFGEIINGEMNLNETGNLAEQYWTEIPTHFPFIELGNFMVMPNHVHGILIMAKMALTATLATLVETRHALSLPVTPRNPNDIQKNGHFRYQNQGTNTISSIVGSYKSVVTKNAHEINSDFAWQSRFYDHIIRDTKSFERIQDYIENNPKNWVEDKFYE